MEEDKTASKPLKDLSLKVAEAIQDDAGKGIVRIDSNFMRDIDVRPGDVIEIKGQRSTVAIVDRAYPGDIGLNIIRMDGLVRRNAKAGISEHVIVKPADVKEAKKVVIAPAKAGVMIRAPPELFKQGLMGRAVVKGDIVSMGGARRRRTSMPGNLFDEVSSILPDEILNFGFGELKFIVVSVMPKQAVVIKEGTEVQYQPEAVEIEEDYVPEVTYEDIGGLSEEITKVREMVELPLKHPEVFERLGVEPPKEYYCTGRRGPEKHY